MSTSQPMNADQLKALQRQMWDNAARGWQEWWETFERGAQKVSDKLVDLAEIRPGHKVLDIATGIGEPAVTAAKRVGLNGRVVATDISPQMIATATARARSLGLNDIMEFKVTDAEILDFPKSSFDAVLSRWGLMFLPNLTAALSAIRHLLVPGGRMAAAVWSTASRVPVLDVAFSTVRTQLNAPPPPPGTPGPFNLADMEALKRSFSEAGFKDLRVETFYITFDFESAESYAKFQQQIAAPIQAMLASQSAERKKQIWTAVEDAVSKYADSHGRITIDNEVICIVGTA